jgi:hypothetical protein
MSAMTTKSRKVMSDRKSDSLATDDTSFVVKGRSLTLVMPPEEIADEGEVRLGCAMSSGRFPAFRR